MAANSKRLSLNISTGPRPLHLVDGNVPSPLPGAPATAPLAQKRSPFTPDFSPSPSSSKTVDEPTRNARRQSSISYHPKDRTPDRDAAVRSPLGGARYALSRSSSLGRRSGGYASRAAERRSVGSEVDGPPSERPPRTLAEKHSELLHFIAQKESKCLELRSQLAIHEAELLQLKRKWERIVSRGFDGPSGDGAPAMQAQAGGAMLEGIREGVQGVSRFIAAGLAIGELSNPSPSLPPLSTVTPARRTHSAAQSSNSSISTTMTKSTRFSQSSASSLGEEVPSPGYSSPQDEDSVQVLMVHDTGATPTMSPNPAFMHKQLRQQQQQEQEQRTLSEQNAPPKLEFGDGVPASSPAASTSKMHRRKSRDVFMSAQPLVETPGDENPSQPAPPVNDPSAKLEASKAKRASLNGSAFPPVSSIPGLGSLTLGASSPPVSSWVGSVGKKWGELQRGSSFSRNQKRASILLSDVSQSIASVLSAPPISTSAPPLTPSPTPTPSYFSSSATSLLDDDDDDGFFASTSVMTPDTKLCVTPAVPQPSQPLSQSRTSGGSKQSKPQDDEDEWNW